MKKIISVDIFESGVLVESLVRMIANNNSGKCEIDEGAIRQKVHGYWKEYPAISPEYTLYGNDTRLEISANNKPVITLTWKEVTELDQHEADLLTQQHLS